MNINKYQDGFTLIELILYLAIISGIAVAFVYYSISITNTRAKTYVVQEVHANARTALDIISYRIKAANGVNSPLNGASGSSLSLAMADVAKNPTVFDLDINQVLRITEGLGSSVPVTSDEVRVTSLTFTNLTSTSARGNVRVQMTMGYDNPSGGVHYTYSRTFQTTVSVRQ